MPYTSPQVGDLVRRIRGNVLLRNHDYLVTAVHNNGNIQVAGQPDSDSWWLAQFFELVRRANAPTITIQDLPPTPDDPEDLGECYLCETPFTDENNVCEFSTDYSGTHSICRSCSDNYAGCCACEAYGETVIFVRDSRHGHYCESCLSEANDIYFCNSCDEYVTESNYNTWNDTCYSCEPEDDEDDDRESEVIHNYSYKPDPLFHHTADRSSYHPTSGTPYLGLELEIEVHDYESAATIVRDAASDLIYCKDDGSIDCGFEMVTHPMTLETARERLPFAELRTLRNDFQASAWSQGIHVHVSRDGFSSDAHVFKWMKLLYRNQNDMVRIARRKSNRWAAFRQTDRKDQIHHAEKLKGTRSRRSGRYSERYSAINVENMATFEVRIFRGSLRKDEIMSSLEVVHASVEYTRQLTANAAINGGLTWAAFYAWYSERPEYANLLTIDDKTTVKFAEAQEAAKALLKTAVEQRVAAHHASIQRQEQELVRLRSDTANLENQVNGIDFSVEALQTSTLVFGFETIGEAFENYLQQSLDTIQRNDRQEQESF